MRLTRKYNMKVLKKDYFLPFPYFYKIYKIPVEIELYMKKLD
jgi:hypothetical protein